MGDKMNDFEKMASDFELLVSKAAKKLDPKAKDRNRGKVAVDVNHPKNKSNKQHFPMNSANQARNALARASQLSKAPEWWSGSLQELVSCVARAVKKHYPSIEVSKAGKTPGKG